MDKIERVAAALAGHDVDRVPVSFWYHFPGCVTGPEMVEAHLRYYRTFDPDFLKVMNDNGYDLPAGGPLRTADDWRRVEPLPLSSPCFQNQLRPLSEICRQLRGQCMVITTVFGPFATARRLFAPPHPGPLSTLDAPSPLVQHLREKPDLVEQGLKAVAESLACFAVECLSAGADGIYYSAQGSGHDIRSDEEFRRFLRPLDRMILETAAAEGRFHLLHVCGRSVRLEDYLALVPGARENVGINWAVQQGNPSLTQARERTDACLAGGIDEQGPVVTGPEQAIRDEVARALSEGGRRKFILAAGCTVPSDVPTAHLLAACQAARGNSAAA